jgi:hypothetical protein
VRMACGRLPRLEHELLDQDARVIEQQLVLRCCLGRRTLGCSERGWAENEWQKGESCRVNQRRSQLALPEKDALAPTLTNSLLQVCQSPHLYDEMLHIVRRPMRWSGRAADGSRGRRIPQ